jgi:hypothetical protein
MRTETGYGSSSSERDFVAKLPFPTLIREGFNSDLITTLELDSCNLFNLDSLPDAYVLVTIECPY